MANARKGTKKPERKNSVPLGRMPLGSPQPCMLSQDASNTNENELRAIVEEKSRAQRKTEAKVQALEAALTEKESRVIKLEKELRANALEFCRTQQKTEAKVMALEVALTEKQQKTEVKVQALEAALTEKEWKLQLEKKLRANEETKIRNELCANMGEKKHAQLKIEAALTEANLVAEATKVMKLERELRANVEEKSRTQQKMEAKVLALEAVLIEKESKLKALDDISQSGFGQWYWLGPDGESNQFAERANVVVEHAYEESGGMGIGPNITSGTFQYTIDFNRMVQRNLKTGTERGIERVLLGPRDGKDVAEFIRLQSQALSTLKVELHSTKVALQEAMSAAHGIVKAFEEKCVAATAKSSRAEHQASAISEKAKKLEEKNSNIAKDLAHAMRDNIMWSERVSKLEQQRLEAENRCEVQAGLAEEQSQELRKDLSATALENSRMQQEIAKAKSSLRTLREDHRLAEERKDLEASDSLCRLSAMWKNPLPGVALKYITPKNELVSRILRELSHPDALWQGSPSVCHKFQGIIIRHVQIVHNPDLWQQYKICKTRLRETHSAQGVSLEPLKPEFHGLDALLNPDLDLDKGVNEAILIHGCEAQAAEAIVEAGWDIRYTSTRGGSLYGEGMYFSSQPCKCNQYTSISGPKHLVIGRVALGDPAYLRGEYKGRLPPQKPPPTKGRFDSIIIDPQHSTRGQAHSEYVVFDGKQAYPELVITYEVN